MAHGTTIAPSAVASNATGQTPRERYRKVRSAGERLSDGLSAEDCLVQSMPDVSPTKWHLAHTTWFFETFLLERFVEGYVPDRPEYRVLFNSYYNGIGRQFPRSRRGVLSRPSLDAVRRYRRRVDERVESLLDERRSDAGEIAATVELGLNHEQQHQELMLTDIKHVFWSNPLRPAYCSGQRSRDESQHGTSSPLHPLGLSERRGDDQSATPAPEWVEFDGGLTTIGHHGAGFHFDNEGPAHDVYLRPFRLASRPVTNREFLEFVDDGGYRRPELWLSDGWDALRAGGWECPLYWERGDGRWREFTLAGMCPLDLDEPVCHVGYYEADAFARWANGRLPTEAEWETAARTVPIEGNFVESGRFHPAFAPGEGGRPQQLFGDVWEWTASPYVAYPGYQPSRDALGEYNGKFMCNQFVLRGGSCATPRDHVRPTYRNFFQPDKRWQFSGIRLARDA